MPSEGISLYHGSYAGIDEIELDKCDDGKDFGKGFYLTPSKKPAVAFIRTSLAKAKTKHLIPADRDYGFVTEFEYQPVKGVKSYEFPSVGRDWLYYISINRRKALSEDLRPLLSQNFDCYDILTGKIADDATNTTLNAFLTGTFGPASDEAATNFAIGLLLPNRLDNQVCFRTEKALACLKRIGCEKYVIGTN